MNFVRFLNSFCKNTRGRRMAKTQNSEGPPPPLVEPVLVPRPRMVHFRTNKSQYLSRSRFMFLVYCLAFVLLIVALIQWEFVSHTKDLTDFFLDKCLVSIVCMLVAIPLMAVFLLVRAVRYLPILGWLLVLVIISGRTSGGWYLYPGSQLRRLRVPGPVRADCRAGGCQSTDRQLHTL
ncbi:uncharacterized protein Dana_GF24796, isoform D [Drosophila ananassae]|uniref:Uncharacterized protein, isoform D n=1 Tax=Drosophila ananassae TaxID=7217 RepID=A0A0P8YFH2_DROAN|nr:uncharacterized protein LOC6507426 isoform X2 [Drosophila ananassae]KPU77674.1 uncharacterized protein Dana_GF24796, isoform D [Drosophila ananassae]